MCKRTIMIIADDMKFNRFVLNDLFKNDFEIIQTEDGEATLALLREREEEVAVLLLDIFMPKMDGYEVLEAMKKAGMTREIPVVVITALNNMDNELKALELGAADLIVKPFAPSVVRKRVQNVVDSYKYRLNLENKVEEQRQQEVRILESMKERLAMILHHPNMEPIQHIYRVGRYTRIILERLTREAEEYKFLQDLLDEISDAAMLHDVGTIVLSKQLLERQEELSEDEKAVLKTHTVEGCKILGMFRQTGNKTFWEFAYNICHYHHEYWDGSGYPYGLKGNNIPIYVQVATLMNEYDYYWMISSEEEAEQLILSFQGTHFSPQLIKYFLAVKKERNTIWKDSQFITEIQIYNSLLGYIMEEKGEKSIKKDSVLLPEYYSLLRYIGGVVLKLDTKIGQYMVAYDTYSDLLNLKKCGKIEDDLLSFIAENAHQDFKTEILEWMRNLMDSHIPDDASNIGKAVPIWNNLYEDYCWYQISLVQVDSSKPIQDLLLIVKNLSNDMSVQKINRMILDINSYKQENKELRIRAQIEELTGLYNKTACERLIRYDLEGKKNMQHGFIIMDLDNFKYINDSCGHYTGDEVLRAVGILLNRLFRETDIVGRIGGDEFLIFLKNISDQKVMLDRMNKFVEMLDEIQCRVELKPKLTVSIGAALYPKDGKTFETLFQNADKALYTAKRMGKNQLCFYSNCV